MRSHERGLSPPPLLAGRLAPNKIRQAGRKKISLFGLSYSLLTNNIIAKRDSMSYMNYAEQLQSHLSFLCSKGFDLTELRVDAGFVRCLSVGMSKGRGELSYKTTSKKLDNGQVGLGTWCRTRSLIERLWLSRTLMLNQF